MMMAFVILKKTRALAQALPLLESIIFHQNNSIKQTSRIINCSISSTQMKTTVENDGQFDLKIIDDDYSDYTPNMPEPLDHCTEDLSHIGPYETPSFNFAKYVNQSPTLKKLVKLGVDLSVVEGKKGAMKLILPLDFDQHIKPYIQFYYNCGVPMGELGKIFTKNPFIFNTQLNQLSTRINYLQDHHFKPEMIARIISKNPFWLSLDVTEIDKRLGYFQMSFKLTGNEVRLLSVKHPKLITSKMMKIEENTFAIKEEMGFDKNQSKLLLLKSPFLWTKSRVKIVETFDYAHNEMGLPHECILNEPNVLLCKKPRLEKRHRFLVELKKAQYNPEQPLYVSPLTLVAGTDEDFCKNVAQVPIHTYNQFLKTF